MADKKRSKRNKTIVLSEKEIDRFSKNLKHFNSLTSVDKIRNTTINQDMMEAIKYGNYILDTRDNIRQVSTYVKYKILVGANNIRQLSFYGRYINPSICLDGIEVFKGV